LRDGLRKFDVFVLCGLVATAEENDQNFTTLQKLDPVAGAIVHAHFAYAIPDRFDIARVFHDQTIDPCTNAELRPLVPQVDNPTFKLFGLDDLDHKRDVTYKLQIV
jgi:hypothetical protein